MQNLFFPAMQDVGAAIARSPHVLLGLDYDGTLTPIVAEPARAVLSASMRQVLFSLARRAEVALAIFAGREGAELERLVGIPEAIYAGNHGLEIHGPNLHFVDMEAAAASQAIGAVAQRLAQTLQATKGVEVENKGLTLSVHYRHVAPLDREALWHAVRAAVDEEGDRFAVSPGDMVYEISPHRRWNKGCAMQWIKEQLGRLDAFTIYVGDDATDEDAFVTLADEPNTVTIKIGDSAATDARYTLPSPAEVASFLQWIDEIWQERHTTT